jgi:UDPglucose 6-dehydrogenase
VTAACLAALGHEVVGLDFDGPTIANLRNGVAPVFEPGLEEMIQAGLASGKLTFSAELDAFGAADVAWMTYDTPVDELDEANAAWVMAQIERSFPAIPERAWVLISSQLPVGSVRRLERRTSPAQIAYCPENLRLGRAIRDFMHPDRLVVGVGSNCDTQLLRQLLMPMAEHIEWMSIESAEMTKHAINAFFATSVAFANEIASICEAVGADAKEVERGLRSESRIGPRPYLSPGAAFAGGTLAREVRYLNRASKEHGVPTPLLSAVLPSNEAHKSWVQDRLRALFADLSRTTVAIWGLTYKPGTDTLRRSSAADLCDWLIDQGAAVQVHDPMVQNLPPHWDGAVARYDEPLAAARGAQALVIATAWPMYRTVPVDSLLLRPGRLVVLDADRFLPNLQVPEVRYFAVGMPAK